MQITHKPFFRTLAEQLELEMIVEELRKRNKFPILPTTIQCESTQRNLARDPKDDEAWQNRPPLKIDDVVADKAAWAAFKVDDSPENQARLVAAREISIEEFHIQDGLRKRRGNTLGESKLSATTLDSKQRAISAIVYTPAANVTKAEVEARAVNLVEIKSNPLTEEWVSLPWYKALLHWVKGNQIKQLIQEDKKRPY